MRLGHLIQTKSEAAMTGGLTHRVFVKTVFHPLLVDEQLLIANVHPSFEVGPDAILERLVEELYLGSSGWI